MLKLQREAKLNTAYVKLGVLLSRQTTSSDLWDFWDPRFNFGPFGPLLPLRRISQLADSRLGVALNGGGAAVQAHETIRDAVRHCHAWRSELLAMQMVRPLSRNVKGIF